MARSALAMMLSVLFSVVVSSPALAKSAPREPAKKSATVKKHVAKSDSKPARKSAARAGRDASESSTKGRVAPLVAQEKLVRKVTRGKKGRREVVYQRIAPAPAVPLVPPVMTAGDLAGLNLTRDPLDLKSNAALVIDQSTAEVLFEKNAQIALPIASITKLMTSLVVVEANQNMDELISVTEEDVDREKFSHSRLRVGSQLTRANMLHIALMSSENRAASALGRNYP
ncbi:MAG TPA: D-alanyl-D-alanine carboxypeptidase, partial [Noviherbaspirillum sp.]